MRSFLQRTFCYLAVLLLMPCCGLAAGQPLDKALVHGAKSANLADVLIWFDELYQIPLVAEFDETFPSAVRVPAGNDTAREVLDRLTKQTLGMRWYIREGVVVFEQVQLAQSSHNPMNLRFDRFEMPKSTGDFHLMFPQLVAKAAHGIQGFGIVTSGFGLPADQDVPLRTATLHNLTAFDILIYVAGEVRPFFSVYISPNASPTAESLRKNGLLGWEMTCGPGMSRANLMLISRDQRLSHAPKLPPN